MAEERTHSDDDAQVHRFVDGDLSETERVAFEARLAVEPALAEKRAAVEELRAIVAASAAASRPSPRSEALWATIAAAIDAPASDEVGAAGSMEPAQSETVPSESARPETAPSPTAPRLRALPGGAPDASRPASAEERRQRRAGVIIGVLALAAAALLVVLRPGEDAGSDAAVARATQPEGSPAPAVPGEPDPSDEAALAARDEALGTEVLEVDFGAGAGTIFAVEGEGGERFAVVWLDDEEAPIDAPAVDEGEVVVE